MSDFDPEVEESQQDPVLDPELDPELELEDDLSAASVLDELIAERDQYKDVAMRTQAAADSSVTGESGALLSGFEPNDGTAATPIARTPTIAMPRYATLGLRFFARGLSFAS